MRLLLWPGAGSGRDHPSLVALERALAPVPVERLDFGYRAAGRTAPPRAERLVDEVAKAVADRPRPLVVGGRSMGGRVCSLAVAGGVPAAGLVLLAYPLHPPGRPDRLRTAHLPALELPCLFVSGTRDPFGSPDELEAATAGIPGPVTHVRVEGARHELKGADARVADEVRAWLGGLGPPG